MRTGDKAKAYSRAEDRQEVPRIRHVRRSAASSTQMPTCRASIGTNERQIPNGYLRERCNECQATSASSA